MKGATKAMLASIATAVCFSLLLAGSFSLRGSPGELMATNNAVAQARAELQEAASSNNLAALDAAIEHGESVLSSVRTGTAPARTQSLAMDSASEVAKWRLEADNAAAKVEKLRDIQARARSEAKQAKRAEQQWMGKAQEARSEAQQLAARRSASVDSLEEEKSKLKARLESNEAKIKRVEAIEGEAESRAAQRTAEQRAVYERAQHREIAGQRAALSEQKPLSDDDTNTLRQTYGYDADGRKVKNLEAELQRQIGEYRQAREMVSHHSREQKEQKKEKQLMDEIDHIKHARVALLNNRHSESRGHSGGSSNLKREREDKSRLLAKEKTINEEIARLDGNGPRDRDAAILDSPKMHREESRALEDQEELPDFHSMRSSESSKLAKMSNTKHMSVLQGFESALGDSRENAKKAAHSASKKQANKNQLPGVNSYSWWSQKSEKVAAKKAQLAALRHRIRLETHHGAAAKTNCHNLYACIGSMFSGKEDSSKLAIANRQVLHRQQTLALLKRPIKHGKLAADHEVSKAEVLSNPQAPLLGILSGGGNVHNHKLPGVAESRWGGTKFFDRLFGTPTAQAGTPRKNTRVHPKLE